MATVVSTVIRANPRPDRATGPSAAAPVGVANALTVTYTSVPTRIMAVAKCAVTRPAWLDARLIDLPRHAIRALLSEAEASVEAPA